MGLSACSSSKSQICKDSEALKSSLSDLKKVDVTKNGTSALTSAVQTVQTDAAALATQAKSEFGPQVTALNVALTTLSSTIDQAKGGGAAALPPVVAAAGAVQTAGQTLVSQVDSAKC
jgi:hypothetical protein